MLIVQSFLAMSSQDQIALIVARSTAFLKAEES